MQVADVVAGFRQISTVVAEMSRAAPLRHYCQIRAGHPVVWQQGAAGIRAATLHDIEHGEGEAAEVARLVADRIVRCHLRTMGRLNVQYDLLTWEGDILRLQFWNKAFERLKAQGTVYFQPEGRLAGCWVMRIADSTQGGADGEPTGDADAVEQTDAEGDQAEKVIVRSNGTVTYVGKDMAYQFWKFGLLGEDFHYRLFGAPGRHGRVWATSSTPAGCDDASRPAFGRGHTIYNVIDVRQSYLQKLLKQALEAARPPCEAERSSHLRMVALAPDRAPLGYAAEASKTVRTGYPA